MKKRFAVCCLAAVLALTGTGCGGSAEGESEAAFTPRLDTEQEVTLNVIGIMQNFESLEAVISDFAEYYPNCEVLYTAASGSDEYWNTLESRLLSDDTVGLFMMSDTAYDTGDLKDLCVDLSQEEIDFDAIQPEVISSCTVDGKLYQIPLMHNTSGMFVNKTLLADQGLEIPTNYSEFLEVCESLKQAGYTPVQGYAALVNKFFLRSMSYVLMNNAFESDSADSLDALAAGETGSAAILQPVFDVLYTMYANGYMDTELDATYLDSYNEAILKFFEGDVPFMAATTETFSGTKKRETKSEHFLAEPFEYAFMAIPLAEEGSYSYIENWYGFAVNENCADREWAVEFLRFLTTNEQINQIAYIKGMPSVAVETDDDRFIGLYSEREDYYCTNDTHIPSNIEDALYAVEMDLANGKITVDQATGEMERRILEEDFTEKE